MSAKEKKEEEKRLKNILKEEILAMVIIKRSCRRIFKEFITHCKNKYLLGKNIYLTSIPVVLKVLNDYEVEYPTPRNSTSGRCTRTATAKHGYKEQKAMVTKKISPPHKKKITSSREREKFFISQESRN